MLSHDAKPERALRRMAVIRFLLQWSDPSLAQARGVNFGATGFDEAAADALHKIGLVTVYDYKPHVSFRRYRRVTQGPETTRFGAILREELRSSNVASIASLSDGIGRVAFEQDWRERRSTVTTAVDRAISRWVGTNG